MLRSLQFKDQKPYFAFLSLKAAGPPSGVIPLGPEKPRVLRLVATGAERGVEPPLTLASPDKYLKNQSDVMLEC